MTTPNSSLERLCLNCGKKGSNFPKCGKCKNPIASYCCKACQVDNWATHRHQCKSMLTTEQDESSLNSKFDDLAISSDSSPKRLQSDRSLKKRREAINSHHGNSSKEGSPVSPPSPSAFSQKFSKEFSSGFTFGETVGTKPKVSPAKSPSKKTQAKSLPPSPSVLSDVPAEQPVTSSPTKITTSNDTTPKKEIFSFAPPSDAAVEATASNLPTNFVFSAT